MGPDGDVISLCSVRKLLASMTLSIFLHPKAPFAGWGSDFLENRRFMRGSSRAYILSSPVNTHIISHRPWLEKLFALIVRTPTPSRCFASFFRWIFHPLRRRLQSYRQKHREHNKRELWGKETSRNSDLWCFWTFIYSCDFKFTSNILSWTKQHVIKCTFIVDQYFSIKLIAAVRRICSSLSALKFH
jgi:hypothetical protein